MREWLSDWTQIELDWAQIELDWTQIELDWTQMKPGSPIYSVPCLATKIFPDIIRLLGAHNLSKKRRSPKIGQMRVILSSKNKYLKNKLGPLKYRYCTLLQKKYTLISSSYAGDPGSLTLNPGHVELVKWYFYCGLSWTITLTIKRNAKSVLVIMAKQPNLLHFSHEHQTARHWVQRDGTHPSTFPDWKWKVAFNFPFLLGKSVDG